MAGLSQAQARTTYHLNLTVDDRYPSPYYTLSFDVPEGTIRLDLQYEFCDPLDPEKKGRESGSTIDLGLFDARGCEFLTAQGFRGWSGSARSRVEVGLADATPGYLPGPLYPGTWHVLLGLYQIAPQGCAVTLTITLTRGQETSHALPVYIPPGTLRHRPGWYRGDLHCHTHHSDGTADMATLVTVARAQGLDFLSVTEHNTVSHLPDLTRHATPDLLLIPGIEITTYRGHANVWGIREWYEFRVATDAEMLQIRERVRQQAALSGRNMLFSINHPKPAGPPWDLETLADADAIEVWQAPWWISNHISLAFWDELLRQGHRLPLVGGSDKHQRPFDGTLSFWEVGTPTTWVYAASLSETDILSGIGAGHVFVSAAPAGPRLEWTARAADQSAMMGDELYVRAGTCITFNCRVMDARPGWLLRVVNQHRVVRQVPVEAQESSPTDPFVQTWQVQAEEDGYWRLEVILPPEVPLDKDPAALHVFALSNPIYVRLVQDGTGNGEAKACT